ncbi:hypothetical protein SKAU_G00021460 [Synaphobranchus kaupii]|uniref:Carboxylesterase type B domain-containing protein n=1 Tax=Synaphobranchus kaupii TaxID=118154 RepID=A0A9Q1GCX7_SYNKA|nr:hypothetical protein SKAU_G00021460 [Synaphobranchus kaupii]
MRLLAFIYLRSPALLKSLAPGSSPLAAESGLLQIVTDYIFLCPARKAARMGVASGSNVWMYVFDHAAADHQVWRGLAFCYGHACHGAELPFLFNSASVANFTLTLPEKLLANRMVCFWGAFAHGGDPRAGPEETSFCRQQRPPVWPRYLDTSGWLVMNFTVPSHPPDGHLGPHLRLLGQAGYLLALYPRRLAGNYHHLWPS